MRMAQPLPRRHCPHDAAPMSWINGSCGTPSHGYRSGPDGHFAPDEEADDQADEQTAAGRESDEGGQQ